MAKDDVTPPTCPYCGKQAEFWAHSRLFYQGVDHGPLWACPGRCEAWVGCHEGTKKPLGRLANKELRQWKVKAHAAFDPLWKRKMQRDGVSKKEARGAAYAWLAGQMGLPPEQVHIGMFDVAQCRKVVEICTPYQTGAAA